MFPSKPLQLIVRRYEFFELEKGISNGQPVHILPGFMSGLMFFFYQDQPLLARSALFKGEREMAPVTIIPSTKQSVYNSRFSNMSLIRVILYPFVLNHVYAFPAIELPNVVNEAVEELDKDLIFLPESLANTSSQVKKTELIEAYLLKKLYSRVEHEYLFQGLGSLFNQNGYAMSAKETAKHLGYSERHLNRLMSQKLGFTIKEFRHIHRFDRVLNILHNTPQVDFTQLAHAFEYTDQSHFIWVFKRLSDYSPREYLKHNANKLIVASDSGEACDYVGANIDIHSQS